MMIANRKRCVSWAQFWAALVWLVLGQASALQAQTRVLVISGKGVSADALHAVDDAVAEVAQPLEPRDYLSAARARKLQPTSDTALRELAPKQHANLIVVVRRLHGKLVLSYRDGKSGALVGEDRFALPRRGKKDARLHALLTDAVKAALAGEAPVATSPPPSAAEEETETGEPESSLAPPPRAAVTHAAPRAEPQPEPELAPGEEPDHAPEPRPSERSAERMHVGVALGGGFGLRDLTLPTREGTRSLSTGAYPGLALSVSAHGMIGGHFRLAAAADYRTSVGLSGIETPPLDGQRQTSMRSHALALGLAPGYRFGATESVVLQLFVGWMFQGLRSVADLSFPTISWHGAVLRPELVIPFADGAVSLRLAPELVAVAGIYTTLTGRTGLAHAGMGFSAEVSLDVRLAPFIALGIDYRESHVALGTSWGASFTDVLRFGSARLILRY